MKIHPRLAGAIFIVSYYSVGFLISIIFKIKLFENKIFIGIGVVIALLISIILGNKYYDEILKEKMEEDEFFKKINKELEDNSRVDNAKK